MLIWSVNVPASHTAILSLSRDKGWGHTFQMALESMKLFFFLFCFALSFFSQAIIFFFSLFKIRCSCVLLVFLYTFIRSFGSSLFTAMGNWEWVQKRFQHICWKQPNTALISIAIANSFIRSCALYRSYNIRINI